MSDKQPKTVPVIIATNEPIKAYGGYKESDKNLADLAAKLNGNDLPFNYGHDPMNPISVPCLGAKVITINNGYKAVQAELEANSWNAYKEKCKKNGQKVGGFSYTILKPIPAKPPVDFAKLYLAADMGYFSDDAIVGASKLLGKDSEVNPFRLYQFVDVPACRIVIQVVHTNPLTSGAITILESMLANAIFDCLVSLIYKRKSGPNLSSEPAQIEVKFRRSPDGTVTKTLQLRTNDKDVLKHATDKFGDGIADSAQSLSWDDKTSEWQTTSTSGDVSPPTSR